MLSIDVMTTAALALLLALGASPPSPAPGQPSRPGSGREAAPDVPFGAGEAMEFKVEYLGLTAGRARISVGHREGSILPVFLEARTSGVGALVDLRQQLASYLDQPSGLPRASSTLSIEPGYRRAVMTRFDRDAGTATVRTRGKSERIDRIAVPAGALDFVALVFRLRTLPLEPGTEHAFDVLSGTKLSKVVAVVEQREVLETRSGATPALRVRVPTGFTGRFSEKNPTFIWLSDDPRRVVLRIHTEFSIGRAVAELVSYRAGEAG